MSRMRLIVNPVAGRGYAARAEQDICRVLQGLGAPYEVVRTGKPREAIALAERASMEGCQPVVAVGGDGTVHEVLNGLMRAHVNGGPVGTLGVIPAGSGNDFEYMLRTPDGLEGACQQLVDGRSQVIDVGRMDDRFFANGVGIGFDAMVTIRSRKHRRMRGLPLYLLSALETLALYYTAPAVTIQADDRRLEGRILMVSVANGRRIGGGFMVAPDAELDDGLFDICVARKVSRPRVLGLIPHVIRGTHVDKPPVTMLRARKVVVTSNEDLPTHVDGEIYKTDAHRLEMEILPGRLRVLMG